ncbi:hypothetical protein KFL_004560120 [Klebsormidium nitens]|uniref:Uncharacterized protein n=1 Tax=Klebsormidium nitens TaxID=105231 RepID=A0A1Y1II47_KLENI|nr:hypothetical protein KFL_004560120 [Klebsormidium nitens]|eukprot:GAQ88751.1 hypothetical protein KFL_004560120 [Klebsormidium nitens]
MQKSLLEGAAIVCCPKMEVVKLMQEHWLLAGVLICIFWPALLIFSPVYVPPVLLYVLYVRYNQWKVDPGQSSEVSIGKGEPVDCTTTEKHVVTPASGAQLPSDKASDPACKHVEEDRSAEVAKKSEEKHESSDQDALPDQGRCSGTGFQSDIDHQKRSLFSPTQANLSTQGNGEESMQAKQSGNLTAQDVDVPSSKPSATKAANPALGKPKSQPLTISVSADPPKKPAVVSPKKLPVSSPKKSADHIAKKLEVAPAKKPAEKPVDGSAVAKGTEAPGKVVAQPSKKQSLDAPKALETPKEPSAVAGHEAENSHAAAARTSSGEDQAVHVQLPASGKQEQSRALDTRARPVLAATTESAPSSSSEPVPSVAISPKETKGSNGQEGNEHRSDHHKSKSKKKKKSHAGK